MMRTALAMGAFALLPVLAEATADGPDFLRLTGLAGDPSVALRAGPSAEADSLATLPATTDGLQNFGCIGGLSLAEWTEATAAEREAAARTRWCRVGYGRRIGWLPGLDLAEGNETAAFEGGAWLGRLAGTAWELTEAPDGPQRPDHERPALIRFGETELTGDSGCNRLSGSYKSSERGLARPFTVSPIAMTRMACPPPAMEAERALIHALSAAVEVVSTIHVLALFDGEGVLVALFERRDD